MARRCASKMLLDVLDEARMRTLQPDVRMLWLDIVRMMQRDGIWVLRFGNRALDTQAVSRLVFREESESETQMESKITELCERGLLAREKDGAISCPMLQAVQNRAEINRINGLKGGRPRKVQAQAEMLLPLKGGGAITEKTETQSEAVFRDATTTTTTVTESAKVSSQVDDTEFQRVGEQVLDAIGVDRNRSFLSYGQVRQWMADGASGETILQTVREVMARPGVPAIKSLNYFNGAVARAIAEQEPEEALWEQKFRYDFAMWNLLRDGQPPRVADYRPKVAA